MVNLIKWGTINAAGDVTTSALVNRVGSGTRAAIEALIQAVAAGIISGNPTVIAAAEAAVNDALATTPILTAVETTDDANRIDFEAKNGYPFLSFENLRGGIRLKGSKYAEIEMVAGSGIDVRDPNGYVVERVSGGGSGEFVETHVIIGAGQSNMRGSADGIPQGANDPMPNLFSYNMSDPNRGLLVPAKDPLQHPSFFAENTMGPMVEFGRQYAMKHPDVRVVLAPLAWGGTGFWHSSIPERSWAPSRENEAGIVSLYRIAIDWANEAIAATGANRVAAILWHQGENDVMGGTDPMAYRTEFEALIAGFRSQINFAANAPFIVGQLLAEFRTAYPEASGINAVHAATPTRVARTAFAEAPPAGYVKADGTNTHFNSPGQYLLAHSFWDSFPDAIFN